MPAHSSNKYQREYMRQRRAEAQVIKAISNSLSDIEKIEVNKLLEAGKPEEAKQLVISYGNQKREKQLLDSLTFKRQLMEKLVQNNPAYADLSDNGQKYAEHESLIFLDYVEAHSRLDALGLVQDAESEALKKIASSYLTDISGIDLQIKKFLLEHSEEKNVVQALRSQISQAENRLDEELYKNYGNKKEKSSGENK